MKKKRKAGMTLIETIVAFAIIGIIIVVAVQGLNTIASLGAKAQDTNRADESMEFLIASGNKGDDDVETKEITMVLKAKSITPGLDDLNAKIEGDIWTFTNKTNDRKLEVFRPK